MTRQYERTPEHPEVLRARMIGLAAHHLFQTNPEFKQAGYAKRREAVAPMANELLHQLGYSVSEEA